MISKRLGILNPGALDFITNKIINRKARRSEMWRGSGRISAGWDFGLRWVGVPYKREMLAYPTSWVLR